MMSEASETQTHFYLTDDSESDPQYVILAFAKMIPELGEVYTCELTVEREKWDPFLFLELIDKKH